MKRSIPANWKRCVTCEYWLGRRSPSHWRDHVEYDPNDDRGQCTGKLNRSTKSSGSVCSGWKKWSVLK